MTRSLIILPDDSAKPVLDAIHAATRSVRIKMFAFSHRPLLEAVVAAHRRGVDVKVMLNPERRAQAAAGAAAARAPAPTAIEQVRLQGIVAGSALRGVMLEEQGKTRFVRVGERVGDWTLERVNARDAVFQRGGQQRRIELTLARSDAPAPVAGPAARRAVALCTPRDVIARNAATPIINSRLSPVSDDAFSAAENVGEAAQFAVANPGAARAALNNKPLTIRIGYQTPNARLAATVGAIAKSCAAAGITVQDAGSATAGPVALRNNEIDGLLASTGGAAGSGSSGSSAIDAYAFHSGNGNNLPAYFNERIDGIIDAQAVTSDPKELARLAGESAPILWNDMPTLPLYRQQRTVLTSNKMYAVSSNPTRWGAGWNMDRWKLST